mgnify:CR=1 FL=1
MRNKDEADKVSAGMVIDQFCKGLGPVTKSGLVDAYLEALAKVRPHQLRKLLLEACNGET